MSRIAGGAYRADGQPLLAAVDAIERQHQRARAETPCPQLLDHVGKQIADDLLDCFCRPDRLEQS